MASELRMKETAAPSAPPTGYVTLYAKTDGAFYTKDDAGVETELGAFDAFANIAGTANEITVTDDGDGTITLSLPDNITVKGVTLTGGTVTTSAPLIDSTQTWNDGAVTFTGWKLNVTNTASAAASKLVDLQVGGVSQFAVTRAGNTTITGTLTASGTGTHTISGLLDISGASAGQIKFPASQNASANANTLDDYEEGTWTTSVGGSATYSDQRGFYRKIGSYVYVEGIIIINAIGTGSTTTISGLPFTTAGWGGGVVNYWSGLSAAQIDVSVFTAGTTLRNSTTLGAVATRNVDTAIITSSARLDFNCHYYV